MAENNNLGFTPPPDALAGIGVPAPTVEQATTPPVETQPAQIQMKDVLEHAREAGREKRHKAFGKLIDIMDTATGLIFDKDARSEFGHYCGEKISHTKREIGRRSGEIVDKGKAKVEEKVHQADTKAREIGTRAKNEVIIPAAKKTAEVSVKTAKATGKGALFVGAFATSPVWGPFVAGAYMGAKAEQYINAKEAQLKGYVRDQYNEAKETVVQNIDLAKERARVWGENVTVEVNRVGNNAADTIDARKNELMAGIYEVKAAPAKVKLSIAERVAAKMGSVERWFGKKRMAALEAHNHARVDARRNEVAAYNLTLSAEELRAVIQARNEQAQNRRAAQTVEQPVAAPVIEPATVTPPAPEAVTPPASNGTA